MKAIIISGMPAVGKTSVSHQVARSLGTPMVGGGDVLKEMAVEEGYTPGGEDWWDKGDGMKFLQERKRSADFDKEVDARLLKKAKQGDVVITSYPIPWLTKDGIKVWLSGTVESRAVRMSKRDGIGVTECKEILSVRDRENHMLYKKIYGIEFGEDLKPFDLVVETDSIDESRVAEIVIRYVKGRRD
ncbi:MAG: cytidylate kinase family protein [Nitrososphaerota archaeon]|nr:cytidylate kinase family protein [Nitrososphaerota archaeon]MDG6952667.1 cytidylate kinase family protein [Nitrososphaerota archaeon]MDG6957183.1 cytidylate kinase family protein [Nitrososphaerota archaeon]MDG6959100.1 cytidylate kinase family protein [Nitrososphaerota archaeon]MDG6965194.1 cytidylate kinase family protein [Nitrososphaerota archaeon]